ncbi:uncharacterized protein [Dysidea avara]|uniref:uncharacterized protein n=1 Tax=Dysidea avara TaxID=196820 RepID=UPI00331E18B8
MEYRKKGGFSTPRKRYKRSRIRVDADSFDRDAIRRKIHSLYDKKENLSLSKILSKLQNDGVFSGGRTSLRRVLKDMGFKHRTINDKRVYYEQPRIVHQRHKYLRRMRRNRTEGKPVVYLDETWANAHDGKSRAWVEADKTTGGTIGGVSKPSGKGERLIILHAGGKDGWVPGCDWVFKAKKGSAADYHQEMNAENFERWFKEKLLPALPANCLIVMDNASYHSRHLEEQPKQKWRKAQLKEWLNKKRIAYPESSLKRDLWEIIKRAKTPARYAIDEIAGSKGHEVVRLPVAHCELNPIEMAWSQVKGHVKRNNKRFTLTEVKELVYQGFEAVTSERWQSLIKHVQEEVEDHYWEQDGLHEELLERFLIHVSSDSSDSEDGDGGDGGINDSSTTSNSESESSSEPISSDESSDGWD